MKKNILFALFGALLIQISYFIVQLFVGLIQTFLYRPQFSPNDVVLQSEVVFGVITPSSPVGLFVSYLVLALLLFVLLCMRKSKKKGMGTVD